MLPVKVCSGACVSQSIVLFLFLLVLVVLVIPSFLCFSGQLVVVAIFMVIGVVCHLLVFVISHDLLSSNITDSQRTAVTL